MSQSKDANERVVSSVSAFSDFAKKYERGTGGTTRYIAQRLIDMSPPFLNGSVVLDNACGTGLVTEVIQQHILSVSDEAQRSAKIRLYAADAAPPMIDVFRAKQKDAEASGMWPNIGPVSVQLTPAENLDEEVVPSNSITHSYMNFGLFFCSDPIKAAQHVYRSLAPGGTAFITSWADLGYIHALKKVDRDFSKDGVESPMPFSAQWEDPAYLKDVLHRSGFAEDKIKVVQEGSFFRAKDFQELAELQTDLALCLVRKPEERPDDDEVFARREKLLSYMDDDNHYIKEENGVATKMLANVAICTK